MKDKILIAIGALGIASALILGAYRSWLYIQEVPARVEGVKAAGIGLALALAAILLILSLIVPLPTLYKKFRNRGE